MTTILLAILTLISSPAPKPTQTTPATPGKDIAISVLREQRETATQAYLDDEVTITILKNEIDALRQRIAQLESTEGAAPLSPPKSTQTKQ